MHLMSAAVQVSFSYLYNLNLSSNSVSIILHHSFAYLLVFLFRGLSVNPVKHPILCSAIKFLA